MTYPHDPFEARRVIETPLGGRVVYRLDALKSMGDIEALPYTIKVLLESVLRNTTAKRSATTMYRPWFNTTRPR